MLSYEVLAARRGIMQGRCLIAVQKYAVYIYNEADNAANHANRLNWANDALNGPEAMAARCLPFVMGNEEFLAADVGLSDATLQGMVETVINQKFITPAE